MKKSFKIYLFTLISLFLLTTNALAKSELSNTQVLKLLFPDKKVEKDIVTHKIKKEELTKIKDSEISLEREFYTNIVFIKDFKQNNKNKRIVVTQSKDDTYSCHICAPLVGVALLENNNKKWEVVTKHEFIDKFGTWGNVMPPTFVKIGSDNYALRFTEPYMGMGVTSERTYFIAQVKDTFKTILRVDDSYEDNFGTCGKEVHIECYKFNAEIKFSENTKEAFYPVTITRSGKRFNNKSKIEKFKEIKKYKFLVDSYK